MPVLKNPRHEQFAQLVAKGMPATKAYIQAGYGATGNGAEVNASKLLRSAKVADRLSELRPHIESEVIKLIAVDKQWVIDQLIDNARVAKNKEQIGPANRALELIGKELGMFVDRKELTHTVKPIEEMLTEIEGPR